MIEHARLVCGAAVALLGIAVFAGTQATSDQSVPVEAQIAPVPTQGGGIEVAVKSGDEVTLAGTFVVPTGDRQAKRAAVVFITGSGPQDRDETVFGHKPFRLLAAALAEVGIASLRCDDRGCASSTGDFSKATTFDFVNDAKSQIAWLRARDEIDPARVGVIGHSEGATIGALLAQGPSPAMNFGVLLAPTGITGAEVMVTQTAAMQLRMGAAASDVAFAGEIQRELLAAVVRGEGDEALEAMMEQLVEAQCAALKTKATAQQLSLAKTLGLSQVTSPWARTFLALDPAPALSKISVPLLVLFGELDLQVLPKFNKLPYESGGLVSPVKPEIVLISKANHLFQTARTGMVDEYASIKETMNPEVPKLVCEWVVRTSNDLQKLQAPSPKSSP